MNCHGEMQRSVWEKRYPIVTYEDLFQHKEGIIITACIAGHIPRLMRYNVESLKRDLFIMQLNPERL